eukprot:7988584-Karenia_brevis.AAC.1
MAARTLNVPEAQVIVSYPDDENNFLWHHRILLKKVTAGIWICLTPDLSLCRHNLLEQDHRVLDRSSLFPAPQAPYVYAFDPISAAEIRRFKKRAETSAAILGDADGGEVEEPVWVLAEADKDDLGTVIAEEDLEDAGALLDTKGVLVFNGDERFVERVDRSHLTEWKEGKRKSSADLRTLGDHRDGQGKRRLEESAAVNMMGEEKFEDWPLTGPRAVKEFLSSVVLGPGSLTLYHHEWARSSGVSPSTACLHEHRIL